jgi:hypothetical protein
LSEYGMVTYYDPFLEGRVGIGEVGCLVS